MLLTWTSLRARLGTVLRSRSALLAAVLVVAVVLAGCRQSLADPTDASAATTTVTDGMGKTVEMPADPQRALGFYTTDVDILITLGIPLAPMQPIRGDGYTDFPTFFPQQELQGVSTYGNYPEYNFEKTLEADPDLILNGLGYDDGTVSRLPEIAPTYSVNAFDGEDWRKTFEATAKNLGRTEEYRAWTDSYADRLRQAKQEIAASGADQKKVATIGYRQGEFSVNCYGVSCWVLRDDLGLPVPEEMQTTDATLSAEQLSRLKDVDVAFMSSLPGPDGKKEYEQMLAELEKIPTWRDLEFVKNNEIYTYDMEMEYGSPSGHSAFLNVARKALT